MTTDVSAKRPRQANAEDFHRLLGRLDSSPERAWEAYDRLRQKLAMYFEHHGFYLNAEDLAEETLDIIAKKPNTYVIENVADFAFGVARYVRMHISRDVGKMVSSEDGNELPSTIEPPENASIERIDRERKLKNFLECMRRLTPEERTLILTYYPADSHRLEERRHTLARKHGIDVNALRIRVFRLKEKIGQWFAEGSMTGKPT